MAKNNWYLILGLIVIVIILAYLKWNKPPQSQSFPRPKIASVSAIPNNLPGLQTGAAPWPAEIEQLKDRLKDLNLPALSSEGTTLHIHQHLDIFINGKPIEVPEGIGINEKQGFISPIHTHDTTGIIHVESPEVKDFTLGQFMAIWGVKLTDDCLGGYCNSDGNSLRVYSNGQLVKDKFQELVLQAHQEIVISYGTQEELPSPIPSSFNFPADY